MNSAIKQYGRKLMIKEPSDIYIYNTVGTLVYQHNKIKILKIPASVGKEVFEATHCSIAFKLQRRCMQRLCLLNN